jgi:hypothetical protein
MSTTTIGENIPLKLGSKTGKVKKKGRGMYSMWIRRA